jgi:hypothetical protein
LAGLIRWINFGENIRFVRTPLSKEDKKKLFDKIMTENAEGAVFKNLAFPFAAGRPASGGGHLKYKFVGTTSFIVGTVHRIKRSVGLTLINPSGARVPAGNITVPPNQDVPSIGAVVGVRYLYASPKADPPINRSPRSPEGNRAERMGHRAAHIQILLRQGIGVRKGSAVIIVRPFFLFRYSITSATIRKILEGTIATA